MSQHVERANQHTFLIKYLKLTEFTAKMVK